MLDKNDKENLNFQNLLLFDEKLKKFIVHLRAAGLSLLLEIHQLRICYFLEILQNLFQENIFHECIDLVIGRNNQDSLFLHCQSFCL